MKKTHFIELFHTINKTIVSYISIVFFVCLATTIFLGINWSTIGFDRTMEKTFIDGNMYDVEISHPYGIGDDYINELKNVEGIDDAEGVYSTEEFFSFNGTKYQANVISLSSIINKPTFVEGKLPDKKGEIAFERFWANKKGLKIGDEITFEHNDDGDTYILNALINKDIDYLKENEPTSDGIKELTCDKYVITALIETPLYIGQSRESYGNSNISGVPNDCVCFVNKDSIDKEAFLGYTSVYVVSNDLRNYSTLSNDYLTNCESLVNILKEKSFDYATKRNNLVLGAIKDNDETFSNDIKDAEKKIEDGEKDIVTATKKINDAKVELSDARKKIQEGQEEVDDGWKKIKSAKNDLNNKLNDVNNGLNVCDIAINSLSELILNDDLTEVELGQAAISENIQMIYATFSPAFDETFSYMFPTPDVTNFKISANLFINGIVVPQKEELENNKSQIEAGFAKIKKEENKLNDAQNEIDEAIIECDKNEKIVKDNEIKINNARKDIENGKIELEDGKKQLADYRDATSDLKSYPSVVLSRSANASIGSARIPSDILTSMKYTLSILFVIVGLFVCYSTVSRMVFEQAKLIGTKKALGIQKRSIFMFYMLYVCSATVLGSVIGDVLARFIAEPIILDKMILSNYNLNEAVPYFNIKESLLFFVFELVSIIIFAIFACSKVLNTKTIALLNEQKESYGKIRFYEKTKLWVKTKLLTKTIINNFFNDHQRVFATVVGIIGCCSLMVSSLTLLSNVYKTRDYQILNLTTNDTIAYCDKEVEGASDIIKNKLVSKGIEVAPLYTTTSLMKSDECYIGTFMYVFEDDTYSNYFKLQKDSIKCELTDGIWICKSFANNNNLDTGDSISLLDFNGNPIEVEIGGVFDYHFLNCQVLMNKNTYEKTFDEEYKTNTFFFNRNDVNIDDLYNILEKEEGFISLADKKSENEKAFDALLSAVLGVVITFFISSILLAVIVLLNLFVMFVNEKKRDLITMMINGYSRKEAKKYIYMDTVFLTIVGIVAGTILGAIVGIATTKRFDSDFIYLLREINPLVFVICGILTIILTTSTCLIALRRVSRFKLSDINSM